MVKWTIKEEKQDMQITIDKRSSSKGPPKLLEWLATGERPKLNKKEIKELTERWYKELPEVKLK